MRCGKKEELEVTAKNGYGIWADSTPKNLHRRAASVKSNGACKEEYLKTLRICPKIGKGPTSSEKPILLPCEGRCDCLRGSHKRKMAEVVLCVKR